MYQTLVFSACGVSVVSALFEVYLVAAGALIAAGLFAVADAIMRRAPNC